MKENRLELQVESALLRDCLTEASETEVLDSNGVVTLQGAVRTHEARDRAKAITREVAGVTSVMNELDVI
jgi:osmotically-inducible protein OsmY